MKIQIMSDLHLEHAKMYVKQIRSVDVVVLAGDIAEGDKGLKWAREAWPETAIIYVAGNHEYYSSERLQNLALMRDTASRLGIHFLDNEELILGDVRFLGSTLWTDFCVFGAENQYASMDYSRTNIGDFFYIRHNDKKFTPEQALELHMIARNWLTEQLARKVPGQKTVVVTHHAPHKKSIAECFAKDRLTPCFVSSLDHLVEQSDLWIHGHTHDNFDYRVGNARVVCNPRGYQSFFGSENSYFNENTFVDE